MPLGLSWTLVILCFALAYGAAFLRPIAAVPMLGVGLAAYHFLLDHGELTAVFWIIAVLLLLFVLSADGLAYGGAPVASRYRAVLWATILGLFVGAPLLGVFFFGPLLPFAFLLVPFVAIVCVEGGGKRKRISQGIQVALVMMLSVGTALLLGWGVGVEALMPLIFLIVLFLALTLLAVWIDKKQTRQGLKAARAELIGFLIQPSAKAFLITALLFWVLFQRYAAGAF